MKQFTPRINHQPGDKQRIIEGKSVCIYCDSEPATVFDDLCDTCFKETKVISF